MRILICLIALFCNFISLKLHSNVKRWVPTYDQPSYMRNIFSLRFFLILSLIIGVFSTCGLTELAWYWNIPIYLVGLFVLALIGDVMTDANTQFHMLFILESRPWGFYIGSLTVLSFLLAIYGYNLR